VENDAYQSKRNRSNLSFPKELGKVFAGHGKGLYFFNTQENELRLLYDVPPLEHPDTLVIAKRNEDSGNGLSSLYYAAILVFGLGRGNRGMSRIVKVGGVFPCSCSSGRAVRLVFPCYNGSFQAQYWVNG